MAKRIPMLFPLDHTVTIAGYTITRGRETDFNYMVSREGVVVFSCERADEVLMFLGLADPVVGS